MIDKYELIEILETLQHSGDIQFAESNKVNMVERYLENCIDSELISANYLVALHPELDIDQAEDLKQFANAHTIEYKECYGDGSIIYPLWIEFKTINQKL